jgi:hypothetical protein
MIGTMRKRRLRLALLAVALLGIVAWIVWPTSSAVIIAAKEKYARLQLGMPEAEVVAILGDAPDMDREVYGEWADNSWGEKWPKLISSQDKLILLKEKRTPGPNEQLFHLRAYNFRDGDPRGWTYQNIHIQVTCEQGRLVAAFFYEQRDNTVKRWLRDGPFKSSRPVPFLDNKVDEGRQAMPPS